MSETQSEVAPTEKLRREHPNPPRTKPLKAKIIPPPATAAKTPFMPCGKKPPTAGS